jgi:hypothetical protein
VTDKGPAYGRELKKIVFEETDNQHAKFIIRLRHSSISQSGFFRAIIEGFIKNDERICSFIEEQTKEQKSMNEQRIKKSRRLKKAGHQKIKDFALSTEEVENIFDLIEDEANTL